jgi:hypothetical protein
LPAITAPYQRLRHGGAGAEPAHQRGIDDQEQAGLAQQRFGQIELRCQRAGG